MSASVSASSSAASVAADLSCAAGAAADGGGSAGIDGAVASPPASVSPSSSASSSAGSSPLLAPHKPRPLQLSESDDAGGTLNASEAQSPLYYVPQHLLFTPHSSHSHHSAAAAAAAAAAASGHAFFAQPQFAYAAAAAAAYSPSPSPIHLGAYPRSSAYGFSSHLPLTPTGAQQQHQQPHHIQHQHQLHQQQQQHHYHAQHSLHSQHQQPVSFVADSSPLGYSPSHAAAPPHLYMSGLVSSPTHSLASPAFTFSPFSSSPLPLSPLAELTSLSYAASASSPSHSSGLATDGSAAYFHAVAASSSAFPFNATASAAAHSAQQAVFAAGYHSRDHSAHSASSGSPHSAHSAGGGAGAVMQDGPGRPSSTSISSTSSQSQPRSFGSSVDSFPTFAPSSAASHPGGFSSSPAVLSAFSQLSLSLGHSPGVLDASYGLCSPPFGSSNIGGLPSASVASQAALLHSAARVPPASHPNRPHQHQQHHPHEHQHQHPQQQQQQQQQKQYHLNHHHQQQQNHQQQQQQQHHHHQHQPQQQQQQRGGNLSRLRPANVPFSQSAPQSSSASPGHLSAPVPHQSSQRRAMNGTHPQSPHNQSLPTSAAGAGERGRAANGHINIHTANATNSSKSPPLPFGLLPPPFVTSDGQIAQSSLSWPTSTVGGPTLSPSPPPPASPAQPPVPPLTAHSHSLPLPALSASSPSGRLSPSPSSLLTVESLSGHVVRLCKTHTGSRFVQQKLEQRDSSYFPLLFNEMAASIVELACDNFGHFAVERLLSACSADQVSTLLSCLAPYFNAVAVQKHGSFACQALVDCLSSEPQISELTAAITLSGRPHLSAEQLERACNVMRQAGISLSPSAAAQSASGSPLLLELQHLCTNASGHFVVLRLLARLPAGSLSFVDSCMARHCRLICCDHHGLRVVKAYLAARPQPALDAFHQRVVELCTQLVEDGYGNYSVQAVLDSAGGSIRAAVKSAMLGRLQQMSRSKFGSNVVEKCLRQSSAAWRAALIRELCSQPLVAELLKDRYANYVLQTGLAVCPPHELPGMVANIAPHMPALRENVRSKWRQLIKRAHADTEPQQHSTAAATPAADATLSAATHPPPPPAPHQPAPQPGVAASRSPSPPPFLVSALS